MNDITEILRYNGVTVIKLMLRSGCILEESEKTGTKEFYEKMCNLFLEAVRGKIYGRICSEFDESEDVKKRFRFPPLCISLVFDTFSENRILSVMANVEFKRQGRETFRRTLCQNWDSEGRILLFGEVFAKDKRIKAKENNFFFNGNGIRIFPKTVYGGPENETVITYPGNEFHFNTYLNA